MTAKPYPKLGVPFELTLDGDAPENQPIAMVANDGYNPEGWKHQGPVVKGRQTRKFKLIRRGGSWDEIGAATDNDVEGQWCNAFKAKHPEPDGKGSVGVHDRSWVYPSGYPVFPYVYSDGRLSFRWAGDVFNDGWRWLVPAK